MSVCVCKDGHRYHCALTIHPPANFFQHPGFIKISVLRIRSIKVSGAHSLFRNSSSDATNVSEHSGVRLSILTEKPWFTIPILSENAEVK